MKQVITITCKMTSGYEGFCWIWRPFISTLANSIEANEELDKSTSANLTLIPFFRKFFWPMYLNNISQFETINSSRTFLTLGLSEMQLFIPIYYDKLIIGPNVYIKLMHCKLAYYIPINQYICAIISSCKTCLNVIAYSMWILMLLNRRVNYLSYNNFLCFMINRSKTAFGNQITKFQHECEPSMIVVSRGNMSLGMAKVTPGSPKKCGVTLAMGRKYTILLIFMIIFVYL